MNDSKEFYTISQLNTMIKNEINSIRIFKNISITGEAYDVKYYDNHLYFGLKDKGAKIRVTVFWYTRKGIISNLKNGDNINIYGSINFYDKNGEISINGESFYKINNEMNLYQQIEALKKEYREKGYFDKDKKKSISYIPFNIGVVTAINGDAIKDIIRTTKNRFENINIFIYNSKVQGEGADIEIGQGIKKFNELNNVDVIIVTRGGGSSTDLQAFNSREVIEAIYSSEIPVVSAVGHEEDILLSDYVSDLRASTPTQSIERILPEKLFIIKNINNRKEKLDRILMRNIDIYEKELNNNKNNLYRIIKNKMELEIFKYSNIKQRLNKIKLEDIFNDKLRDIENRKNILFQLLENKMKYSSEKLKENKLKLEKYSYENILKQGYTITKLNNKVVDNISEIKNNDELITVFNDGEIISIVKGRE